MGHHERVYSLEGAGSVMLGAATLTIGGGNPTTPFSGTISGSGGLIKTGVIPLTLSGANTYSGPTLVSNGTLRVAANGALGSGGDVTLRGRLVLVNSAISGHTLNASRSTLIGLSLLAAEGLSSAWNGDVVLEATQLGEVVFVDTAAGSTLALNGVLSGSAGLRKTGLGLLRLSGTNPNTFTGDTEVHEGTLELAKQNAVAVSSGRLFVGHPLGGPGILRYGGPDQVADASGMSLLGGGLVQLSQWTDRIGWLAGSGEIDLGTGTLTVGWNVSPSFYSGAFTGSGSLVKVGANRLTLTGTSTHTGNTMVNEGSVLVNGRLNASGAVQVASSAMLGGTGVVGNVVASVGSRVAPGASPGQLTASSLILSGGELNVELNGTVPGTGYDRLTAGGNVTLSGALTTTLGSGFTPAQGDTFVILDKTSPGAVAGTFDGLTEGAQFVTSGFLFQISYLGGDGNDVELTRVAAPPSQLSSTIVLSDGSLQLQGQGWPGLVYTIEATDSLDPPAQWTVLGTAQAGTDGVFTFTDPGALLHPTRFYRVLAP
jgi:autotransporter-associated beta strand protein